MRRSYFDPDKPVENLHRHSLRGGAISLVASVGTIVLQGISTIVLARILLPEDYGLVAMVSALTGFASIFVDLGTRDAVAQRGNIKEGELSALHWITMAVGISLTAITALSAPLFARFYGEPRLEYVAIALSSTFLLPALYSQQQALMRRALMFHTLAAIDIGSNVLGTAIAIAIAYLGYGYWALVWKPVLTLLFTTLGVWIACGWWPGRPTFTTGVRQLLGFGLNVSGFLVADYVARSVDRVALGYTTGARELGYYQNAFTVYDSAVSATLPLHNVATTALSRLRDDAAALKRAWSTALSSLAYFTAPAFAILAVTGQDLIVVLLGRKWESAGAILAILALRGPGHIVERTLGWLHITAGQPERWRRWGFLNCIATIVALFCGLPFGASGVAAAYAILVTLLFLPAIVYSGHPLGIRTADVLRAVGPQLASAFGIAAAGFAVRHALLQDASPLARILVLTAVCGALYLAVMTFGFRLTRPLTLAISLVRKRRSGAG